VLVGWLRDSDDGRRDVGGTNPPTGQPSQRAGAAPAPPSPSADPAGELVAADDFTGTAPDTARWNLYESTSPNGSSWSPSMVRVNDGELQIVGTGRNPTGQGNVSGGLCWCGTGGNRTYGKWQVRAKFDAGAGYGQIIGLWPQSDKASDGWITFAGVPEADKRRVRGYVVWTKGTRITNERTLSGDFTGWHTYTVEWRETYVKMHVDDQLLYDSTTSGTSVVLPRVPLHLYVQQVVGPKDGVPAPNAGTPDQVTMHIDWVRVYR